MRGRAGSLPFLIGALLLGAVMSGCGAESSVPAPAPTAPPSSTPAPAATPQPTTTPSPTVTPGRTGTPRAAPAFDGARALAHAEAQCAIGPRPTGTEALLATRDYIEGVLREYGWQIVRQDAEYEGLPIYNVIAVRGEGSPRMAGAHYDTRPAAELDPDPDRSTAWIIGGNDGASGVAVLLELARVLDIPAGRQVQLAFFDAEDRGNIDGWPFSVGARLVAQGLDELPIARPEAMVVVDMVGDADLQIFRETGSTPALNDTLFALAARLGHDGFINESGYAIIDDHRPFLEIGIPAADLIDFDYPYWHTTLDTCERISAGSLDQVGEVVELWLEEAP